MSHAQEYLLSKVVSGQKLPWYQVEQLKSNAVRMTANTERRVTQVLEQIKRYMASADQTHKQYQVNWHEYKKIISQLDAQHIKYQVVIGDLQYKTLKNVFGHDSGCCRDCDIELTFESQKIPCVYIKILKKPR
jgi:16S rRNA G1207 methylase RsmC